jgi:hypothetical protein
MVVNGVTPSLLVVGEGGLGKTHTVNSTIQNCELQPTEWVSFKGYSTPRGLYNTLFDNNGKLIIFDDCDSVLEDKVALNILKSALDSYETRQISWMAKMNRNDEYPQHFNFTGRIIFISNKDKSKIDGAILSRSLVVDLSMTPDEKIQRMNYILEDILPELDYDTIVSRIDETELSDNYKAEIEFILLEEISSEVNILISVLDPTWTLKPNIITFNREIPATTSFFFSQEIYLTLQNLYAEQYANQVEDKFDDYIEDEYETGMNSISEQEEKNRIREDEIYNDVYDKVYQQELSKIEDSEYILKQLGGYSKPTISNLFKRTRKLPRVVK